MKTYPYNQQDLRTATFWPGGASPARRLWPISSLFSCGFSRRSLATPPKILGKCLELGSVRKSCNQAGFTTLEILIALALAVVVMAGVAVVAFGSQSLVADSQTGIEALHKAQETLEYSLEFSRQNFDSVVSNNATFDSGIPYAVQVDVPIAGQSQCSKKVTSRLTWAGSGNRTQKIELTSTLMNIPQILALGGACSIYATAKAWSPPATWASSNMHPAKPRALAALNRTIYMGGDKPPYLFIAHAAASALGQSSGLFVNFANGFTDSAAINDIVAARASNGKTYAYVAHDSATNQLEVIDMSDLFNPVSIVQKSLSGVSVSGSFPQGFRIFYYDNRVYITVRETTGPELHVFNAATPWNAASVTELSSGTELNRTVEEFAVIKQVSGGTAHYIAYMATDKNTGALSIFDVTAPAAVTEITAAEPSFAGNQDGASVFLANNRLYFGRQSNSGADLYVFDASNPLSGFVLPVLGQKDLGTSAVGLAVSGKFLFVTTTKASQEFQVLNADPASLAQVSMFNFPNSITNGMAYEHDWVYAASQGNDSLRIIYSPNE